MRKKAGIVFLIFGAVLLIAALLSFLYSEHKDKQAGAEADRILTELRAAMDERVEDSVPAIDSKDDGTEETAEAFVETDEMMSKDTDSVSEDTDIQGNITQPAPINVGGYDCIGYIDIPSLSLTLPVMAEWDQERLDMAPCRHFGSVQGEDLVIAGHNFKRHFAYLSRLNPGDAVMFYDTNGNVYSYKVSKIQNVDAKAVDAVQNSGYPLVLYTCTYFGDIRTAVFCEKAYNRQ